MGRWWSKTANFNLNPRNPLIYRLAELPADVSSRNFSLKKDLLRLATLNFILKMRLLNLADAFPA
jgi:hypothetical protein